RAGGKTWTSSRIDEPFAFDVTFDARVPGRVYAAGFSGKAWRSDDAGATFAPIDGFDFKWAQRVALDPRDPAAVFVLTFGGGVWWGPAAGAPPETRVTIR
ncbi:MAG TPA: hypothetical protein VHB21_06655, partial [Minicystis sp.]|nr:hypothetical protein [Minicystis sp.]